MCFFCFPLTKVGYNYRDGRKMTTQGPSNISAPNNSSRLQTLISQSPYFTLKMNYIFLETLLLSKLYVLRLEARETIHSLPRSVPGYLRGSDIVLTVWETVNQREACVAQVTVRPAWDYLHLALTFLLMSLISSSWQLWSHWSDGSLLQGQLALTRAVGLVLAHFGHSFHRLAHQCVHVA